MCFALAASSVTVLACSGNGRLAAPPTSTSAGVTTVGNPAPEAAKRVCQTLDTQLGDLLKEIDFDYGHKYPKSTFEQLARESAAAVREALNELAARHLLTASVARACADGSGRSPTWQRASARKKRNPGVRERCRTRRMRCSPTRGLGKKRPALAFPEAR